MKELTVYVELPKTSLPAVLEVLKNEIVKEITTEDPDIIAQVERLEALNECHAYLAKKIHAIREAENEENE